MRNAVFLCVLLTLPAGAAFAEITPLGELRRAMPATVEGTVERITDEDEFILADRTGQIRVYIGPNPLPVRVGENIRVEGFVDDDLRMELYADTITLADGRMVSLPRRY
jgi:uncharacterized protein YdeI (BOF family)